MSLLISVRQSGNTTILDLRGHITIGAGSDSFRAELRTLAETLPCDILINLAEVTQVDSTGINALVQSYVTLKRKGAT
jgi:anti-anti-sigma factor